MSEARNLRLVERPSAASEPRPRLLAHAVRTTFLIAILLTLVGYQIRLGNFLNVGIWLPVFATLMVTFGLNAVYLVTYDPAKERAWFDGALFGLDVVTVTLLIYFTGTAQSLFLFLYLVNLLLGGLTFGTEASWRLAAWTSACFSALLIVSPEVSGQSLLVSLVVNNLAFAAVTYLSARLTGQVRVARADLAVAQNLNDLLVDNITTGILLVTRSGFVSYVNPPAERSLGVTDARQRKLAEVFPELGWPWTSLTEDAGLTLERREIDVRGLSLEVTATRFNGHEGRARGWLFLIDDRTEQKALEDRLRQREKLAAVGQLAAGIAHEIRNPLASISGSVQLMLDGTATDAGETERLMKIIDKEINRLNGLITEFLEYVRPEGTVRETGAPVDLSLLAREVLDGVQFNQNLRRDVQRETHLNPGALVWGNRDKLKQALLNFVINAYQAMEKTERPRLEVTTVVDHDFVTLVFKDNGCGIKAEHLTRIFEPFHTTKARGTGLGLAVTHKILEAHGAEVKVESEPGVGTTFAIRFDGHRDLKDEDPRPLRLA